MREEVGRNVFETSLDDPINEIGETLYHATRMGAAHAITATAKQGQSRVAALGVCLNIAAAALLNVAELIANHKEPKRGEQFNTFDAVTEDTLLFAALLANSSSPNLEPEGAQWVKSSPKVYNAALAAFQKLTGHDPSGVADGLLLAAKTYVPGQEMGSIPPSGRKQYLN